VALVALSARHSDKQWWRQTIKVSCFKHTRSLNWKCRQQIAVILWEVLGLVLFGAVARVTKIFSNKSFRLSSMEA